MTTWNLNTPPDETERLRARVRHLQERLGETRERMADDLERIRRDRWRRIDEMIRLGEMARWRNR